MSSEKSHKELYVALERKLQRFFMKKFTASKIFRLNFLFRPKISCFFSFPFIFRPKIYFPFSAVFSDSLCQQIVIMVNIQCNKCT